MGRKFLILLAAAAALCSCMKEDLVPDKEKNVISEGRVISVVAEDATKTAIGPKQGGGYAFTWKKNDAIKLFELVYENYGSGSSNAQAMDWFPSAGLGGDAQSASFSVDLNSTLMVPEGAKYRYVATYPYDCYSEFYSYFTEEDSDGYDAVWPDSEIAFNHAVMYTNFPYQQFPTATSFDPQADLMVSQQKVLDNRADGTMQMRFARVGAIVKMTLSGLPAGEKVETGYLLFGNSFKVNSRVEYDVELGEVRYTPGLEVLVGKESWESGYRFGFYSNSAVEINPTELYVDNEGHADLWLRLPAGVVNDSFSVRVWTRAYDQGNPGDWHSFGKSVDLAAASRTLAFENGRLTTFSVATAVMEDPYLRLSYSYTDDEGNPQTEVSDNGYISVGKYGAYLNPNGGTVVLDVETNADPSDFTVVNDYSDWADCSFNPETMKLTVTYDASTEYTNYMVSNRESYIYVGLTSFDGATVQMSINQLKRYFADSGTKKSILTWHGGSVTGLIRCNSEPVIECPEDTENAVSWTTEKTETGYNVTFTLTPNESASLSALAAYIRDEANPSTKYVQVNLLRYPKVPDGTYYVVTQNTHNGTPNHWYGFGANIENNSNVFAVDVNLIGDNPDYGNTDYLLPLTFTRIDGQDSYRITCEIAGETYYLSFGSQRLSGQYYLTLNPIIPLNEGGKDLSRWDVVSLGSEIAILNHAYAEGNNPPYVVHYKLDDPSVYLRQASLVEITDNQGSYGNSYFKKATTYMDAWNAQTELMCAVKLYDIAQASYLPAAYN